MGRPLRLLLCDDAPAAREAVRAMLDGHAEIVVAGEAENGSEAISRALELRPDVILMDVAMPILDGVEATRRIKALLPSARIVAFAGSDEREVVTAMTEAGATTYCVKGVPLWELERAITGGGDPLVGLAHALARSFEGGGAADLVARELASLVEGRVVATYLASETEELGLAGLGGPAAAARLETPSGVALRAFAARALVRANPAELRELTGAGLDASEAVSVPLLSDGTTLGALLVVRGEGQELDLKQIAAAADLAAVAIANERKLALTQAEARHDALTGLLNRRAFNERLGAMLTDAAAADRPLSVALLDLDDFKLVNDTHGHLIGDEVLRELSRTVLRTLRPTENAYRVGGEELAVIVDGDAQAAERVAQRIREALKLQRRGHPLPTVSIGIASYPAHARSTNGLLGKADVALYAAKAAGKDRAVTYHPALEDGETPAAPEIRLAPVPAEGLRPLRILLVDDDPSLRTLLRTTLEVVDAEVDEAGSATEAAARLAARPRDVIVLDVEMPGFDGLSFCRELKREDARGGTAVIVLSGADDVSGETAAAAGADAFLRKPFSPLELLALVDEVCGRGGRRTVGLADDDRPDEQLLLYARDLRRLHELELGQRALLERAYRQTVATLAAALESKDVGTGAHSQRVQRYALALAEAVEPSLLDDLSVEYGFLLHDVGKIGIPDGILQKPGPLSTPERRLMQTHPVLGEQMLAGVALLRGEGLRVVRSHHERWDGGGYPGRAGR